MFIFLAIHINACCNFHVYIIPRKSYSNYYKLHLFVLAIIATYYTNCNYTFAQLKSFTKGICSKNIFGLDFSIRTRELCQIIYHMWTQSSDEIPWKVTETNIHFIAIGGFHIHSIKYSSSSRTRQLITVRLFPIPNTGGTCQLLCQLKGSVGVVCHPVWVSLKTDCSYVMRLGTHS